MLQLSLSPVLVPVNAPILAVSAAGTGDFALALALAETGVPAGVAEGTGATADLDPAKPVAAGDPLPPVRQFLAAVGDLATPVPIALPGAATVDVSAGQLPRDSAQRAIPLLAAGRHTSRGDGDNTPVEREQRSDPIDPVQPTPDSALPIVVALAAVPPSPEIVVTASPVSSVQPTASQAGRSIPNQIDEPLPLPAARALSEAGAPGNETAPLQESASSAIPAAPQNDRGAGEATLVSTAQRADSAAILTRPVSDNPQPRLLDLGQAPLTTPQAPPPPIAGSSPASIPNRADASSTLVPATAGQAAPPRVDAVTPSHLSASATPTAVPQTGRLPIEPTGPAADRPAANPITVVRPVSASAQPSSPERAAAAYAPIPASPPIPTPPTAPVIGVAVPALRAFAAGIAATTARPPRLLSDEEPLAAPLAPTSSADILAQRLDPAPRALPPIDMRREDWTRALIDRIGAVHDVANARDTRITLMPDALGKIEVALRQDGDTVHVQFAADAPATRALLADAQPRLAELAEARGLRLGDASVSAGSDGTRAGNGSGGAFGQAADQRRPAPFAQPVNHNRSITTNPARDRADSDHRIA